MTEVGPLLNHLRNLTAVEVLLTTIPFFGVIFIILRRTADKPATASHTEGVKSPGEHLVLGHSEVGDRGFGRSRKEAADELKNNSLFGLAIQFRLSS
jgi:hypothetical protein